MGRIKLDPEAISTPSDDLPSLMNLRYVDADVDDHFVSSNVFERREEIPSRRFAKLPRKGMVGPPKSYNASRKVRKADKSHML